MGFLSGIGKFFKKIWNFIKKILPLLIVLIFIFAPAIGTFFTDLGFATLGSLFAGIGGVMSSLGFWGSLAVGLGVSAILLPDETSEMIGGVFDMVGDVVSGAAEVVGDGIGSVLSNVVFSPFGLVLLGVGLWWLFSDNKSDKSISFEGQNAYAKSDAYNHTSLAYDRAYPNNAVGEPMVFDNAE